MVKLQRITSKVTYVRIQLRDTDSEQSTRLIPQYISALSAQLGEARRSVPPHLTTNSTFNLLTSRGSHSNLLPIIEILEAMALHTKICINDLIFIRLRQTPLLADTSSMEALLVCLNAAKGAVDIMFNFNPIDYIYFPFFLWRQFRTVILTLIRLASLEDPAWDVNLVRRTVDITSILDQTARNLSNVQTSGDGGVDDLENVVAKSLAWVNRMRSCLLAVYQSTDGEASPGLSSLMAAVETPGQMDQGVSELTGASGMDIFLSLDNDFFGEDTFGWPQLYSEGGI